MSRPTFPRTIFEFQERFPDEKSCLDYLIESRWPSGFICPRCASNDSYWMERRKLLQCKNCKYQASVTAGTIMHRSKQSLRTWFWAAYLVTTHTPGMSALQFKKQVGLPSYQTAFMMLHKLRAALVKKDREKLRGIVQVDEAYIGGEHEGPVGRGALGKVIVIGAVEERRSGAGRVRLKIIPSAAGRAIESFLKENVEKGTVVKTDSWAGYVGIGKRGYVHIPVTNRPSEHLPHIHHVFSNLKSWLIGTHHGVSQQHLPAYLNEYVFRFNRRGVPMAAFQTALGLIAERQGPTYKGLYAVAKGEEQAWIHPNPTDGSLRS